jgi:hypothetical protein
MRPANHPSGNRPTLRVLVEPSQDDIVILAVTMAVDMMAHPQIAGVFTFSESSEQNAQLNED